MQIRSKDKEINTPTLQTQPLQSQIAAQERELAVHRRLDQEQKSLITEQRRGIELRDQIVSEKKGQ